MPGHRRIAPSGYVSHALNRGVARRALLEKPGDYDAFEAVLAEALPEHPHADLGLRCSAQPWALGLVAGTRRLHVQQPETEAELAGVRRCLVRNQPFGSSLWQRQTAARLGLQMTRTMKVSR